jgi:hypothetical protein
MRKEKVWPYHEVGCKSSLIILFLKPDTLRQLVTPGNADGWFHTAPFLNKFWDLDVKRRGCKNAFVLLLHLKNLICAWIFLPNQTRFLGVVVI